MYIRLPQRIMHKQDEEEEISSFIPHQRNLWGVEDVREQLRSFFYKELTA